MIDQQQQQQQQQQQLLGKRRIRRISKSKQYNHWSKGCFLFTLLLLSLCLVEPTMANGDNDNDDGITAAIMEHQQQLPLKDMKRQGRLSRNCFNALEDSDANGDGRLDQQEYVQFVKSTTPDGLIQADKYSGLPLLLQSTFFALSCICPEQETACCLVASPYLPLFARDGAQQDYMESLCRVTSNAVEQIIQQEEFPTASPTTVTTPTPPPDGTTDSPTVEPTIEPTVAPTTPEPTPSPTIQPTTAEPTKSPTIEPTKNPTVSPTIAPTTSAPSVSPTRKDSSTPTATPTMRPTIMDSSLPTPSPTNSPTIMDSGLPTPNPTLFPTIMDSTVPTPSPTVSPTVMDSEMPTQDPTMSPTVMDSEMPTPSPSVSPTRKDSSGPTTSPSESPTRMDSSGPTTSPSVSPTRKDSSGPTTSPSESPTRMDSSGPTATPSESPTRMDSSGPTTSPSVSPTRKDSSGPTTSPSAIPTIMDSSVPTPTPSSLPTIMDSGLPTMSPSAVPTIMDSSVPTPSPSALPTIMDSTLPTPVPSAAPTITDSSVPTPSPSDSPTIGDSGRPTFIPSTNPTAMPTIADSGLPTSTPSAGPSILPTIADSGLPTGMPSNTPSMTPTTSVPSSLPTISQSGLPTAEPSSIPSIVPTSLPSIGPSSTPTLEASEVPSSTPTTATPSMAPSIGPTPLPSAPPSLGPTITPVPTQSPSLSGAPTVSAAPTETRLNVIETSYTIVVSPKNLTLDPNQYIFDLIGAMDIVAAETAAEVESLPVANLRRRRRLFLRTSTTSASMDMKKDESSARQQQQRRRLEVRVQLPTGIDRIESVAPTGSADCPNDLDEDTKRCQVVDAEIRLAVTEEHDNQETIDLYREKLEENIQKGRLIEALGLVEPNSPVTIATGDQGNDGGNGGDRSISQPETLGLGTGSIIGIALAAMVICVGSVYVQRQVVRQREEDRRAQYAAMIQPVQSDEMEQASESDSSEQGYAMPFLQFQQEGGEGEPKVTSSTQGSAPGATTATSPTKATTSPTKKEGGSAADADEQSEGNISYENSSGWSDNFSESMGSVDTDHDNSPEKSKGGPGDISGDLENSQRLNEMEAAMKAGDWSSVGASAALLAASQDDRGKSTPGQSTSLLKDSVDETKMDQETAEEFEKMINAGDWEGVIQAAAKLEANKSLDVSAEDYEEDGGSPTSSGNSMPGFSSDGDGTANSGDSSGPHTADHRSLSQGGDSGPNEEVRAEVIELVNKVVPEEAENVDEMLAQFKGREHELLETLRTMQERDIALKAKRAADQQAKLGLTADKKDEKMQRKLATIEAANTTTPTELQLDDDNEATLIHDDDDDSASL